MLRITVPKNKNHGTKRNNDSLPFLHSKRPLTDPKSSDRKVRALKHLFNYRITKADIDRIRLERTDVKDLENARKRIVEFVEHKIKGGQVVAADLEETIRIGENYFTRTSATLTGTELQRFSQLFGNFGQNDLQAIYEHVPNYAEFITLRKFLQAEIVRAKKENRKNLYEKSAKLFHK